TTIVVVTTTLAPTTSTVPNLSFRGRVALEELSVAGVGQGLELDARFLNLADEPTPVFEDTPGSDDGCKVWILSPTQAADVGFDAGGLQISGCTPHIPSCGFSGDE